MLTFIRKFQKGTLIALTIIIVIAFSFLYSDFDFVSGGLGSSDCVIKVYDRCYRVEEAQKFARYQDLAFQLGMSNFVRTLMGREQTMSNDPTNFVFNMLILRKEAEQMGIVPTETEIKEAIPNLPIFQFASWANGDYVRNLLGQLGLTENDLGLLIKDYLSFTKLQNLIGAGIQAVPTEIDKTYIQNNQRYTATVINFDRKDFVDKAVISDEEVKAYFDLRNVPTATATGETTAETPPITAEPNTELQTAPQRGFDFVKFIPEKLADDATQETKAKSEVTFAKHVNKIYSELAVAGSDFAKISSDVAKMEGPFKAEVGKFAPFKQVEAPEALKKNEQLLNSLFSETLKKGAVSVPYFSEEEKNYYIFKFTEVVEPRPMTLEEAKPLILVALKAKKSNQMTSDAANAAKAKLQEAIDQKKSILDAASANNLNLVSIPPFSEDEKPSNNPDSDLILGAVRELAPGQLSRVVERSGGQGYFIAYVDKIEIFKDENKESNRRALEASAVLDERTNLFHAWLKRQSTASGSAREDSILNYPRM